jgi:hypothetical protein
MLVRSKPFREWVTVYYDPERITEEKLQARLRERGCRSAKLEREAGSPLTVMNRFAGPGDLVQIRFGGKDKPAVQKVELPVGWKLVGKPRGHMGEGGVRWFTVRLPAKADQGKQKLLFHPAEGDAIEAVVEVVRKVGG